MHRRTPAAEESHRITGKYSTFALTFLLTALFAEALAAQSIDIPYEKFVLSNGLTVLVHEDHKAPIVAVNVWYHVGSKNERPGKTGFAHLFEHLMFGGSENFTGRYIEGMERIGATDLNGTTNEDRTNYFENVPNSALDYALFAESDRMGHFYNTINKETLDLQRGVVQNEKRQGENEPYAVSDELIQKGTVPASHPYSHTVIGSMDDLNAASLEDVKEWFKTYYGPNNAVLVIAGDIDSKTAKAKVEKYFGDIPPGPPVAHPKAWIAQMAGDQRAVAEDHVPQPRLYKVWNVPEFGAAGDAYLDLTRRVLGAGKSSRLYKRLVYDDQIATQVFTGLDNREISGQFGIEVTVKPGVSLNAVESAVNEELAKFLKDGPSTAELDRAKTQFEAQFIRGAERIGGFGGKADILASYETYTGDAAGYKKTLAYVAGATPADLKNTSNTYLAAGSYTLYVVPFGDPKPAETGVDRKSIPKLGPTPELKLPALQRARLSNGLNLILAERHEIPVVNLWLTVDAGYAGDHDVIAGTASLVGRLMTNGTARRSAIEISDETLSLGATLNAGADLDSSIVSMSALKSKLDPSLDLFADVALHPSFPQADFLREQRIQLARIDQEKAQPFGIALRVLPPLLYGKDHPYGVPLSGSGTVDSVKKISRDDLLKFHERWFKPNNATLVVVGDTTIAEIQPKLEALFVSWKPGEVPKKSLPEVARAKQPAVYLIDRPGSLQSMILTGTLAPPARASIEPTYETMNNIYGGSFSGRLNMNLREDKHYSYGAQTVILDARGERPYLSLAPVQTDKTKESLIEMDKEIKGMAGQKPITETELDRARNQEILELPGSRETAQEVGGSILNLLKRRFPDDYYQTFTGKVQALRTADVNDAAKSLIDPNAMVWVIVGDRAKIEPGLRELKLGNVTVIDADGNVK